MEFKNSLINKSLLLAFPVAVMSSLASANVVSIDENTTFGLWNMASYYGYIVNSNINVAADPSPFGHVTVDMTNSGEGGKNNFAFFIKKGGAIIEKPSNNPLSRYTIAIQDSADRDNMSMMGVKLANDKGQQNNLYFEAHQTDLYSQGTGITVGDAAQSNTSEVVLSDVKINTKGGGIQLGSNDKKKIVLVGNNVHIASGNKDGGFGLGADGQNVKTTLSNGSILSGTYTADSFLLLKGSNSSPTFYPGGIAVRVLNGAEVNLNKMNVSAFTTESSANDTSNNVILVDGFSGTLDQPDTYSTVNINGGEIEQKQSKQNAKVEATAIKLEVGARVNVNLEQPDQYTLIKTTSKNSNAVALLGRPDNRLDTIFNGHNITIDAASRAFRLHDNAAIKLTNSHVNAKDSAILVNEASGSDIQNNIDFDLVKMHSGGAVLLADKNTKVKLYAVDSQLVSDQKDFQGNDQKTLFELGSGSHAIIRAENSILDGDATYTFDFFNGPNTAKADAYLSKGSKWHVYKHDSLTLAESEGVKSDVRVLSLNNAELLFAKPDVGQFKGRFFQVDELDSDKGVVQLWTSLGNDESPSDVLSITKTATGTTELRIKKADDAQGAQTDIGIKVVHFAEGATQDQAQFVLNSQSDGYVKSIGAIASGAYDYYLKSGKAIKPADDNVNRHWYLTQLQDNDIVVPVTPTEPTEPNVKPAPYRPEVGAYFANKNQSFVMQRHKWQDRKGDFSELNDIAWVRTKFNQTKYDDMFNKQRKIDSSLIHFGSDIWRSEQENGSRFELGLMGLIGHDRIKTHSSNERRATGTVDGYNIGLYATWLREPEQHMGWYVDGWLMQGWFKNKVSGQGLKSEKYNARNLSASVETGYRFHISEKENESWYLEPQAQAIWSSYRAKDFVEATNTKIGKQSEQVTVYRVGMKLDGQFLSESGKQYHPFVELNYWRMPSSLQMSFTGLSHDVIKDQMPKHTGEAAIGLNAKLNLQWHVWGRLAYQFAEKNYRDKSMQIGLGYRW